MENKTVSASTSNLRVKSKLLIPHLIFGGPEHLQFILQSYHDIRYKGKEAEFLQGGLKNMTLTYELL